MGYFNKKKKGNEDEISADELLEQLKADLDQERGIAGRTESGAEPEPADTNTALGGRVYHFKKKKIKRDAENGRPARKKVHEAEQQSKEADAERRRTPASISGEGNPVAPDGAAVSTADVPVAALAETAVEADGADDDISEEELEALLRKYLGQSKDDIGKASPDENALALDDGPDASETADQGADPGTSENGADAFSAEDTENAGVFDDEDFSDVIAIFQKKHPGEATEGIQTFADEGFLKYVKSQENDPEPEEPVEETELMEEEDLLSGTSSEEIPESEFYEAAGIPEDGEPEINGEFDQTDLDLMIAFGMEEGLEQDDPEAESMLAELEEKREERYQKMLDDERPDYTLLSRNEYVSRAQNREVFSEYKKTYNRFYLKLFAGVVFLAALFLFENHGLVGWQLPNALDPEVYPVVYTLVDLQLVLFIAALSAGRIWTGFKNMLKLRPTPESITGVLTIFSVVYSAVICFISPVRNLQLFNFPVGLCAFLHLIYSYLLLKREIMSFKVISSKKTKFVFDALDDDESSREREIFGEYISDAPDILKIKRTAFVDGFVRRSDAYPRMFGILRAVLPIVMLLAALCFTAGYLMSENLYTGISVGYITLLLCMPVSVFLSFGYPLFRASKLAFGQESAIIGDRSVEEYADASVISFEDKEVFPSYGIKVRSVKVYGNNRIDNIIYNAASVYSALGGPLADVFEMATTELGRSRDVKINHLYADGFEAAVSGKPVLMGKNTFMRRRGYGIAQDKEDAKIEASQDISIMYMAYDGELAAKLYIEYTVDTDFEALLKQLYRQGMCVAIRTCDPNITNQMLATKIKIEKYPVRILKCDSTEDMNQVQEHLSSGIVSKRSAKALLQTLSLCEKVLRAVKGGVALEVFTIVFGVLAAAILLLTSMITEMSSLYVALYQLLWIVPALIVTRIQLKK